MKYLKSFEAYNKGINLSNFKVKLKTLHGLNLPKDVDNDFNCANNELVNLLGSPK